MIPCIPPFGYLEEVTAELESSSKSNNISCSKTEGSEDTISSNITLEISKL